MVRPSAPRPGRARRSRANSTLRRRMFSAYPPRAAPRSTRDRTPRRRGLCSRNGPFTATLMGIRLSADSFWMSSVPPSMSIRLARALHHPKSPPRAPESFGVSRCWLSFRYYRAAHDRPNFGDGEVPPISRSHAALFGTMRRLDLADPSIAIRQGPGNVISPVALWGYYRASSHSPGTARRTRASAKVVRDRRESPARPPRLEDRPPMYVRVRTQSAATRQLGGRNLESSPVPALWAARGREWRRVVLLLVERADRFPERELDLTCTLRRRLRGCGGARKVTSLRGMTISTAALHRSWRRGSFCVSVRCDLGTPTLRHPRQESTPGGQKLASEGLSP